MKTIIKEDKQGSTMIVKRKSNSTSYQDILPVWIPRVLKTTKDNKEIDTCDNWYETFELKNALSSSRFNC